MPGGHCATMPSQGHMVQYKLTSISKRENVRSMRQLEIMCIFKDKTMKQTVMQFFNILLVSDRLIITVDTTSDPTDVERGYGNSMFLFSSY